MQEVMISNGFLARGEKQQRNARVALIAWFYKSKYLSNI